MDTTGIVLIVLAVIVVAALAVLAARAAKRRELKERYGNEYDRAVDELGGRSAAEAELRRRERAHRDFQLKDLTPEQATRYRAAWTELQAQFIDDPIAAVHAADQLVTSLVTDRGYPVAEFDDRVAQLSVEHARVLDAYREAHQISVRSDEGSASTEDLRRAVVLYRELVADLLGDPTFNEGLHAGGSTEPPVASSELDELAVETPGAVSTDVSTPAPTSAPTSTPSAIPTTIPTVDGKSPTAADLSANEGYVAADADPAEPPVAVAPDDAGALATDADTVEPVSATSTRHGRSTGSTPSTE